MEQLNRLSSAENTLSISSQEAKWLLGLLFISKEKMAYHESVESR
ncbi:hypothetical protein J4727_12575 [Providencia rettgeri]|uniref:Uncharacterized protein n=1 Tax=Providencia rettgeri TaxID=587 RepID=A0A939SLP0_PRORE|nr:hypothetical protein [Providencia rettgeri]